MTEITYSYSEVLEPLLQSLNWKGRVRQLKEALPAFNINNQPDMDMQMLRDTLSHLGYSSTIFEARPSEIAHVAFPLLYVRNNGNISLVHDMDDITRIADEKSTFLEFKKIDHSISLSRATMSVLRYEIQRFLPLLNEIFLISLFVGGISLAPILYNRSIYDHVIASGSSDGVSMLIIGVMLALGAEIGLRYMRNRKLAFFGGRIDHYVGCSVFERLLFLPPFYTERSSVSAQLARLRDFESVREFFTGPLSTLFFEFPLIAVYLTAMCIIAGWLTLVPVALIVAYVAVIATMGRKLRFYSRLSANTSTKRQEFLLETVTKLREIRMAGMENVWQERYRTISAQASMASFQSAFSAQVLEAISYGLMIVGGAATLTFGVTMVIAQTMTVGTLIAAMMLIWRIIAPLQICCASLTRLQQLISSTSQVEKLLSATPEHDANSTAIRLQNIKGAISFHRVSLKYAADTEPALLGVSLDIHPGQIIAIKGNNGSGKSTLLKLILGMYQPQAGSVRIDGMDIRQFDPLNLRQSIAYVPQHGDFFPGTIRDNLLFSNPEATDNEIANALRDSCALDEVMALPQKLDTVIQIDNHATISFALRQKLNLARAYLRNASIYLFDEASYSLGRENDLAFAEKIRSLRGNTTVIMATHREDHMRLADQLLFMNKGELTHAGAPDQVLTVLKGRKA